MTDMTAVFANPFMFATALTERQMLDALESAGSRGSNIFVNPWFILTGLCVVFILMIVLLVIQRMRLERQIQESERRFDAGCQQRGLDGLQGQVLSAVTAKVKLKRKDSIFSMPDAFETGAGRLIREYLSSGGGNIQGQEIHAIVDSVKDRLGFSKKVNSFGAGNSNRSSRAIEIGKQLSIAPVGAARGRIAAVVISNDEHDFTVRPEIPVAAKAGSVWDIQYRFGAGTWGFEAVTVSSCDEGLVLSHSDKILFVNRRRFLRAAVQMRAFISHFPAIREGEFEQPEFVEGVVSELSGPGLKIEAPLDVIAGQRVLVVFELEPGRVVEDTAVVRWCADDIAYQTIGLELTGLNDASVNQLIRATNNTVTSQRIAEVEQNNEELAGVAIDG